MNRAKIVFMLAAGVVALAIGKAENKTAPRKTAQIQPNRLAAVAVGAVLVEISSVLISRKVAARYDADALKLLS